MTTVSVVLLIVAITGLVVVAMAVQSLILTLRSLRKTVDELRHETLLVVAEMQKAVDNANGEIARVDSLLDQAEVIGTRVEATSRLAWIAMRNPLVKLASVSLISARRKRRRDPVIDTQVVLEQLDQPTMVRTEPIALSSRRKRQRRAS
ncbi:MAG: hypothetical protein RLZZ31_1970 [Actinomycetota bacterium]|jgi:hypothetical protein